MQQNTIISIPMALEVNVQAPMLVYFLKNGQQAASSVKQHSKVNLQTNLTKLTRSFLLLCGFLLNLINLWPFGLVPSISSTLFMMDLLSSSKKLRKLMLSSLAVNCLPLLLFATKLNFNFALLIYLSHVNFLSILNFLCY